jgi:hypothetical protein
MMGCPYNSVKMSVVFVVRGTRLGADDQTQRSCRPVKYTVASGLFSQIEDKTKVTADERAPSRLPPSSPPAVETVNARYEPTCDRQIDIALPWWMNVAMPEVQDLVHPSAAFLKRVQIAMSLNATWHGW